jgi:hypothetical protein
MRRRLVVLAAAAAVVLGGSVSTASAAAAAPSPKSVHFYCEGGGSAHPGKHLGWRDEPTTERRRNVGGTCPV